MDRIKHVPTDLYLCFQIYLDLFMGTSLKTFVTDSPMEWNPSEGALGVGDVRRGGGYYVDTIR